MLSRFLLLLSIFLTLQFYASFAQAQQVEPGDPCPPAHNGRYMHSGGPSLDGDGYLLVCNGTEWRSVFGFSTDTVFRPSYVNAVNCNDGDWVVYDNATGGMRCTPITLAGCDLPWSGGGGSFRIATA